jgi:dephospho-CoA kinase
MSLMFVVGLTGGIGSGKSVVATAFVRLGGALVDTDILARRLTAPGGAALAPLSAAFGADILARDGSLNRAVMRARVFACPDERRRLEDILHPLIRREAQAEISAAVAPYVLLAIPLLVETGGRENYGLNRVLVVDCSEAWQVKRVMARSGLTEAEARAIMAAQASRTARLAVADDVLENNGSLAKLEPAVARLHHLYLKMAARKSAHERDFERPAGHSCWHGERDN